MFRCVSCGTPFYVPSEKIPASGGRGRCTSCGAGLIIFPNGQTTSAAAAVVPPSPAAQAPAPPQAGPIEPPSPVAAQAPPPVDEPIWEIRLSSPNPDMPFGPHRLSDLRHYILEGKLTELDFARPMGMDWLPVMSYPAIHKLFVEKIQIDREVHGDEDHCANHRDETPGWRCFKCGNYLCKQCVVNRPVIAGGSANYLCMDCETQVETLKGKSALKSLGGLFKKPSS